MHGYLVGRLQGGADVCEALDAAVFAELAVDLGAGLLLDGVGEGEVRDMPEEGFIEREAYGGGLAVGDGGAGRAAIGGDVHAMRWAVILWKGICGAGGRESVGAAFESPRPSAG